MMIKSASSKSYLPNIRLGAYWVFCLGLLLNPGSASASGDALSVLLDSQDLMLNDRPINEGDGAPKYILRSYNLGEMAIYYINQGLLAEAEHVLTPAVNNVIENNGRMTRWFYENGPSGDAIATGNGDSSVISIACSLYLKATLGGPANALFRSMNDSGTTSISVENETRRAISLWHAGAESDATELVHALIGATWNPGSQRFSSGVHPVSLAGTNEYARDAFSLLVLSAHGMGILQPYLDIFSNAAARAPAYTFPDPTNNGHIIFGYVGNGAIPEFMYTDAEALRVLSLTAAYDQRRIAADALNSFLNGDYSTTVRRKSAINYIMQSAAVDSVQLNHYFPTAECAPTTCEAQSASCGQISDGCGETLHCGPCVRPQFSAELARHLKMS